MPNLSIWETKGHPAGRRRTERRDPEAVRFARPSERLSSATPDRKPSMEAVSYPGLAGAYGSEKSVLNANFSQRNPRRNVNPRDILA